MAINILLQISLFSEWIEAMVITLCCNSTLKQHYEDDFLQNCLLLGVPEDVGYQAVVGGICLIIVTQRNLDSFIVSES